MTKYSESSTKSSFFTTSARLLVSKLPLQRNKDSQSKYMFKNWINLDNSFQCLTVQHFQKYILPKHPLLAEQIKCPYTYFIPYRLKSLESVAPLLCVISICQIPHTLKQPSYLCKSSLETQEPLKPLIVKSRIQSLRVTTNLVQIYIQSFIKSLKQYSASYSQKTKNTHRFYGPQLTNYDGLRQDLRLTHKMARGSESASRLVPLL